MLYKAQQKHDRQTNSKRIPNAQPADWYKTIGRYGRNETNPKVDAAILLLVPVTDGSGAEKAGVVVKLKSCTVCAALRTHKGCADTQFKETAFSKLAAAVFAQLVQVI